MKHPCVFIALMLSASFAPAFQGLDDFRKPSIPLEERVKFELGLLYYEGDGPPLEKRLLALGDSAAMINILLDLAARHKGAQPPGVEYRYLISSLDALGRLGEKRALPIAEQAARSGDWNVRMRAIIVIGRIGPASERELLLTALHDEDHAIRFAAAESLSKLDDPTIMTELEVQASHERDHWSFLKVQALADAMRTRIREKAK
jgi:hypothetical protein